MFYSGLRCEFEITKDEKNNAATFSGIASTSDVDLQGDIIAPGAFDPIALKDNGEPDVLMLRDHDKTQVIGGWHKFQQDGKYLMVEGELCLEVEKARETYALLKGGFLAGLSVGFIPDPNRIRTERGKRIIGKALLRECSVVASPANAGARVIAVKADVAERLMSYGLSPEETMLLMEDGPAAFKKAREREQAAQREIRKVLATLRGSP